MGKKSVEGGKFVTVNFTGVSDDKGIIRRELGPIQRMAGQFDETIKTQSKDIDMEPGQLRELLIKLERAYA